MFQEGISEFQVSLGCFKDSFTKGIWLLTSAIEIIVVSSKSVKGSKLEPSATKFFSCVTTEATDIRSDHLETPESIQEVISNGSLQEIEVGIIITSPMESILI